MRTDSRSHFLRRRQKMDRRCFCPFRQHSCHRIHHMTTSSKSTIGAVRQLRFPALAGPGLRYHTLTQPCSGGSRPLRPRINHGEVRAHVNMHGQKRLWTWFEGAHKAGGVYTGLTTPGSQTWYTFRGLTLLSPLQTEVCGDVQTRLAL